MDSSCVPAGMSHLLALGYGIALIALSPWLVLLGRAAYRNGPAFQLRLWNAAPLWLLVTTGVVVLFGVGRSFEGWMDLCLAGHEWNIVGVAIIGVGVAVALTAVARMILGRIRVGNGTKRSDASDEANPNQPPADADAPPVRTRNLPIDQRRVIVAFALTYGAAVIVIIVGVGIAR